MPPFPSPQNRFPRATEIGHGSTNGGSHGGELSAFRELLTEFRNLTERYGQALLALGESRGEVASLRGRVELLETRMELRLGATAPMTAWTAPELPPEDASDEPDELTDGADPVFDTPFARRAGCCPGSAPLTTDAAAYAPPVERAWPTSDVARSFADGRFRRSPGPRRGSLELAGRRR